MPDRSTKVTFGDVRDPGAMIYCAPAAILLVARNRKAASDVTEEILCEKDESIAIIMPRILLRLGLDKRVL